METWQDEVEQAVKAGEREFGPLAGHQTIRHYLVHRCEEILAEQVSSGLTTNRDGALARTESD